MRSTKTIGLFAACGFVLSFVAGLFSHSSILSVLIKALIFALVFGALGFGISMVFSKFLDIGTSGEFQGDYSTDSASGGAAASAPVTGQHVDITIQDEELKPSSSDNHFVVGDNHQMLNDSDVSSSKKTESENPTGFVPLRNFETVKNISGTESVTPTSANPDIVKKEDAEIVSPVQTENASYTEAKTSAGNFGDEGIDTLPDMDGFVFGEESSNVTESDDDDSLTDSGFSSYSSSPSKKSEGPAEVQDAALMAKAISSVLSDENSL